MRIKRFGVSFGGLLLSMGLLAACGSTAATVPTATPAASTQASASASGAATTTVASSAAPRSANPSSAASSAAVATPSSAATPIGSPTRATAPGATPGTPTSGTPSSSFTPAQAYTRLQGQPSHRQRWAFTGFTIAGISGNLMPVFDVVGNNRKVILPNVAGVNLEAYQVAGTISVANPVGGGFVAADPTNPLSVPAQALFALPDTLIFTLAPVNTTYTQQGTQSVNGRTVLVYRTQVALTDLGFISPTLQGQSGSAATMVYLDSTQGFLIALESTITSNTAATTATARLDVTDIGQVPAIAVPK